MMNTMILVRAESNNNLPHSPAVIEALVDVREEIAINMPAEVLRVRLTDRMIVGVCDGVVAISSSGTVGFVCDIFTGVCVIAATLLAFEVVVPISNALDLWGNVMIVVLLVKFIGIVACIRIGSFIEVGRNMWTDMIAPFKFILMLASSKRAPLFDWEWCSS